MVEELNANSSNSDLRFLVVGRCMLHVYFNVFLVDVDKGVAVKSSAYNGNHIATYHRF